MDCRIYRWLNNTEVIKMNVYLVTYWCGNCVDDYYEEKLGIFSSLEQAEMKKWDYVKSLNLKNR